MHLPSLVQTVVITLGLRGLSMGGNLILANVRLSLRLGSLLNPIMGGSGKWCLLYIKIFGFCLLVSACHMCRFKKVGRCTLK